MTELTARMVIEAGYVSANPPPKLPSSSGGIPIRWTVLDSAEFSTFSMMNYEVIATPHRKVYERINEQLSRTDRTPRRSVIQTVNDDVKSTTEAFDQCVLDTFPTHSLGRVAMETASIADHVFFHSESAHLFDRLLLPLGATPREVQRRFRRWSTRLHPDRFVERTHRSPHLVNRMEAVYTMVGDAYRILSDPIEAKIHYYWLLHGRLDLANERHRSKQIQSLFAQGERTSQCAALLEAMVLEKNCQWVELSELLDTLQFDLPTNRMLKIWRKTVSDVLRILSKE